MKNWVINLIILGLVASIVIILVVISMNNLTTNESTLLGVLLTVLSFIASWVVSDFFARKSLRDSIDEVKNEYQNNLRTYALNAAEKVNNLSNELSKLAMYLKSELDKDDSSDEYALYSKIERIESAIHIVNTLKSVNDTSLSDWKGVIGDELEVREEEKEEREERLLQITERIENIVQNQNTLKKSEPSEQLNFIKKQLEHLGKSLNSTSINTTINRKPQKEKVEQVCPNCKAHISYTQREKVRGNKTVKCSSCGKRSLSRFSTEKGFYLIPEQLIEESFNCPNCNEINKQSIGNVPFTKEIVDCNNCHNKIKVTRNLEMGLTVSAFGEAVNKPKVLPPKNIEITDEILDLVEGNLPVQPWPVHIHKVVAEKVGLSNKTINKAIGELINRGRFNPQIDGVVYVKSNLKREE